MPDLDPNIALPIAVLIFLIGFPLFLILFLVARRRANSLGRELTQEKTRAAEDRDRILAEEKEKRQAIEQKYSPIIDMEAEVGRLKAESEEFARNIDELRSSYASTPMVRLQFRPVADRSGRPYATKQSGHRTCQQTRSNRLEPSAARRPVRRAKRRDHGSDLTPSTVTKEFAIERTAWNGEDTPPESDGPLGHYRPCR
ncbi:hypothetical protein [Roseovarius tolerans]